MKRLGVAVLILTAVSVAARAPEGEPKPEVLTVETRTGHLREEASFVSRRVTTLPVGERLRVLDRQGDFYFVEASEGPAKGWIYRGQVTRIELVLKRSDPEVRKRLKRGDRSVAARSFAQEVESFLRHSRAPTPEGYARLDEIAEDPRFDPDVAAERIARFREEGGLTLLEEG